MVMDGSRRPLSPEGEELPLNLGRLLLHLLQLNLLLLGGDHVLPDVVRAPVDGRRELLLLLQRVER